MSLPLSGGGHHELSSMTEATVQVLRQDGQEVLEHPLAPSWEPCRSVAARALTACEVGSGTRQHPSKAWPGDSRGHG